MTDRLSNSEVFDLFAAAYRRSTDALAAFIAEYPDLVDDLVDYAHELNLQRECAGDRSLTPEDQLWIDEQVLKLATEAEAADPFSDLQPNQFVAARKALGVPSPVLEAFRDRLVSVSTVPTTFLFNLADQLKISAAELVSFLDGPPRLSGNLAFKATAAPAAPRDKVSFTIALQQTGVSAEAMAALLEEDA